MYVPVLTQRENNETERAAVQMREFLFVSISLSLSFTLSLVAVLQLQQQHNEKQNCIFFFLTTKKIVNL